MYLSIIILPLLGSIVAGFFGRKVGVSGAQFITCFSVITTTILAIIAFFEVGFNNIPVSIELFRWIDSEWFNIVWGFEFDSLTVYLVGLLYKWKREAVLVWIQLYKNIFIPKFILCILGLVRGCSSCTPFKLPVVFKSSTILSRGHEGGFPNKPSINKGMRSYSTLSSTLYEKERGELGYKDSNFLEWFVGFTDAEGNFIIHRILKKDKVTTSSFSFMFKITLHKDDEKVLRYIKDKLAIGGVRLYKDECIFNVTDQKGIALLISIFDKFNLNTTKYLDYLDFKEAFLYYSNRNKDLTPDMVKDQLIGLKNKMNTNRIHFDRPENSPVLITKSWLLGFIEGDGSFFLRRDNLVPTFAISNSIVQLSVMVKIKEFFEKYLDFNSYSLYKLKNSSIIAITTDKNQPKNTNTKNTVSLTINNLYVLNNYLIPFFADMEFLTKKGEDFNDFKMMTLAIYVGAHRNEYIRSLILKLSNTMNNFRLSTYKGEALSLSQEEISQILSHAPIVEHLLDGRVIDSTTKKVLPKRTSCVYEICGQDGEVFLANSLTEAASIVGLYPDTLSKYLDIEVLNSKGVYIDVKKHKIRRVRVFAPK